MGLLLFHRLTWSNDIYFDEIPRLLCSRYDIWDMQYLLSNPVVGDEQIIMIEDPVRVSRWAIARRVNNLEENKPKWNAFSKDIVAGLQAALSIMEHRVHGEQFDTDGRTVGEKLSSHLTTIIKAYGKWADYLGSNRASFYVPRITCSPFYPRGSALPFGDGMVITPAKHPVWGDPVFDLPEIQGKKVSYWRNDCDLAVDIFGVVRNPDDYITLKTLDELAAANQERLLDLKIAESHI